MEYANDALLVDHLWREIEQASHLGPAARKQAIEAVTTKLVAITNSHRTAPLFFLLGYGLYFHPDRLTSVAIQQSLEGALQSALRIDPSYARAHMYLGHEAFDLGKYEEARSHFAKVDLEQLDEYWALKVREMRLCCTIAIDGLSNSMSDLEKYVQIVETHPVQDIWPHELAKWIKAQAPLLSELGRQRLRRLADRLDRAGHFTNWFSTLA